MILGLVLYSALSQGEFELQSFFIPNILVKELLDYDKVQKVTMTLYAQVSKTLMSSTHLHVILCVFLYILQHKKDTIRSL